MINHKTNNINDYENAICNISTPPKDKPHYDGVFKKRVALRKHRAVSFWLIIIIIFNLIGTTSEHGSFAPENISDHNTLSMVSFDDLLLSETTFSNTRQTLKDNNILDSMNKDYIEEYLNTLEDKYPQIDLRVFEYNLKDLDIIWIQEQDTNTLGEYYAESNTIILYFPDPPQRALTQEQRIVIYHELTHALHITYLGNNQVFQFRDLDGYGAGVDEGFTEVFTGYLLSEDSSLLDFLSKDHSYLGYGALPEACASVMGLLEGCYSFNDFFTKDIYTFRAALESIDVTDFIEETDDYLEVEFGNDSDA